ncbi:hypothetical protein SCOCK_150160 [Actinacidiphila cocklensis]|uniref:Uncharacterized protein n=1 Tax=Actinacidiphila cocklensis TaxID=887465 RepID=A0A9W4GPA8_9ACTN|nr:hypothetical protein SCOCK_150160 [Actinacidiphila cocklensis]
MLVGTADSRVHAHVPGDQTLRVGLDLQLLQDPLPGAVALSLAEEAVYSVPRAVSLGDVRPRGARSGTPPYTVDQLSTCLRPRPARLLPHRQQRLQPSRLPVCQIPSRHNMITAIQDPLSQQALIGWTHPINCPTAHRDTP